jgi:hypothetical protein
MTPKTLEHRKPYEGAIDSVVAWAVGTALRSPRRSRSDEEVGIVKSEPPSSQPPHPYPGALSTPL